MCICLYEICCCLLSLYEISSSYIYLVVLLLLLLFSCVICIFVVLTYVRCRVYQCVIIITTV
jgi:hypothetical protein